MGILWHDILFHIYIFSFWRIFFTEKSLFQIQMGHTHALVHNNTFDFYQTFGFPHVCMWIRASSWNVHCYWHVFKVITYWSWKCESLPLHPNVSFTGNFLPDFYPKNIISTYSKDFSWKKNPNSQDFEDFFFFKSPDFYDR
jgi:hypothetical protein